MGEEFEVYAVYAEEIAAFFFSFACSICGCETYPTSHEFPNSCPQPRSRTGELIGRGIPSIFSGASDESLKAVDLGAQSSFPQRQRFAASGSDLNLSAGAKSEKKGAPDGVHSFPSLGAAFYWPPFLVIRLRADGCAEPIFVASDGRKWLLLPE